MLSRFVGIFQGAFALLIDRMTQRMRIADMILYDEFHVLILFVKSYILFTQLLTFLFHRV
jgi:hypothetical protein